MKHSSYFTIPAIFAGVFAMPASSIAATVAPCISHAEASAFVIAMLPGAAQQLVDSCLPLLPTNAALNGLTRAKIASYETAAEPAKPLAGLAVKKAMAKELPTMLPGTAVLPFVSGMASATIAEKMDKNMCQTANNLWPVLTTMQPDAIGSLLATMLLTVKENGISKGKSEAKSILDGIKICPYTATMPSKSAPTAVSTK
jgi:hypothetical protein